MGSTAHDYEALHSIYDSTILLRVPFYFFFMHTLIYISYMSACYTQLSAISHLYECLFGRTRGVSKNRPDSISDVQAYTIHTLSYSTADSTADSTMLQTLLLKSKIQQPGIQDSSWWM